MPIGVLGGIGLGLAGAGIAAKTIGARQQAKSLFTEEDERRQAELLRLRRQGRLGLSGEDRGAMEADAMLIQGAALRDQEALTPQAVGTSSRDVFLQALGSQEALAASRQASARDIRAADLAEKKAQRAEIAALADKEAARKAGLRSALAQGFGAAADLGAQTLMAQQAKQDETREAAEAAQRKLNAELAIMDKYASLYGTDSGSTAPTSRYNFGAFGLNPTSTWSR